MAKRLYVMTDIKRHICECDAKTIAYYRRNPCIACEDLLGIECGSPRTVTCGPTTCSNQRTP